MGVGIWPVTDHFVGEAVRRSTSTWTVTWSIVLINVWVRTPSGWQMRAWQSTPATAA